MARVGRAEVDGRKPPYFGRLQLGLVPLRAGADLMDSRVVISSDCIYDISPREVIAVIASFTLMISLLSESIQKIIT